MGCVTTDHTGSDASFQMATKWLRDCNHNHKDCNTNSNGSPWYPTRLLDLGHCNSENTCVWLIHTAETRPSGPYATLSHCWGSAKLIQLTAAIATSHCPVYQIKDLPRTFREAVETAKRLGIRYLWVDSLCIIQDKTDIQDWYREASLMDKVYLNSYCNLSAADANDSTEGLFRPRQSHLCGPINFKADLSCAGPDSEPADYVLHEGIFWRRHVLDAQLNSRGWVLQERLLAPRVLHFCRYQLFWECREVGACEACPEGISSSISQGHNMKKLWHANASAATDFYLSFWYREVVGYYATMDLSVPSDKLIALSGIAKHIMPRNGDTYVAGMWRKSLGTHLFWVTMPDPRTSRPEIYRAPTWSWASHDGPISFGDCPEEECLVQVEDVSLQYATEDITGAVTSGWMDLRGSLKPMKLCQKSHEYRTGEQLGCGSANIAVVVDGVFVCSSDTDRQKTWRDFP